MATRDDQGLFAAILQNPEDDALRLVYADWLEENGDEARAEFIRLQITGSDPRREAELLFLHQQEWLAFLAADFRLVEQSEFKRGLLWQLVLPGASDQDLLRLRAVPELECLDLKRSSVTDAGMIHLSKVTNLRAVDLRETLVTSTGIALLRSLERLVLVWNPEGSDELNPAIDALRELRNERFLALSGETRREEALVAARWLCAGIDCSDAREVRDLDFSRRYLADSDLIYLEEFPSLERLNLNYSPFLTARGLIHLSGLKRLRYLNLAETWVADLEPLARLTGLEELALDFLQEFPTDSLRHLMPLKRLRKLSLTYCHLTNADVDYLTRLTSLEELELEYNQGITDAGLELLASLPNLKVLKVDGMKRRAPLLRRILRQEPDA